MFDQLTEKLTRVFQKLRGQGRLDDAAIDAALREVRISLLEADVNFKVVKEFTARVAERARGQEVLRSLTPAQQVVKVVHEELTALMGTEAVGLARHKTPPTVVLMVGLQGSGKTTTLGKLARHLKNAGERCLLVAGDVHRPAAAEQLATLGAALELTAVVATAGETLEKLAARSLRLARETGTSYLLVDTAGRLHIDEAMMAEAADLVRWLSPQEILLVVDAMTGQEAVNVAQGFARVLPLTGAILTKLDGDARGGAALSLRQVVGVPIKFVGVGEKPEALDVFHPARMASRILGMGDMLTLIEKAQAAVDHDQARVLEEKIRRNRFTLDDFRDNLRMMRKMGSMEQILSMLPGMGLPGGMKDLKVDEKQLTRVEAIISSMTPAERANYKILNTSRRERVARGSGNPLPEVHRLIKQFEQMQMMFKKVSKLKKGGSPMQMRRALFR